MRRWAQARAGSRVCPGRQLAMLEMNMALSTLLLDFDVESVATADGAEPVVLFSFTMEPAPLTMRLVERRVPLPHCVVRANRSGAITSRAPP